MKALILFCLVTGALSVAAGCCLDNVHRWPDTPGAIVTPVSGSDQFTVAWSFRVSAAVADWNNGLTALGCPAPFQMGPGGHAVRLIAPDAWSDPSASGFEDSGEIEVKYTASVLDGHSSTLQHELGHGLGLHHVAPDQGPSIMTSPAGDRIYPRDFQAAACSLGCGSCDGVTP